MKQRIGDVKKVRETKILDFHRSCASAQVNIDSVVVNRNCPEQPLRVRVDARIEVVYLSREIGEVKLTSVEVQSDEPKGPLMYLPVAADVHPFHEAHIRVI